MRTVGTFINLAIILLLISVGIFFLAREALMWWGVNSFRSSLLELKRAGSTASYATQCAQRSPETTSDQQSLQLRFTSHTEYVLEVQCDQFGTTPILISKKKLPQFVTKVPGSSGVLLGDARSVVELRVFENIAQEINSLLKINTTFMTKSRLVGIESAAVIVEDSSELPIGLGPVAACEGYGFECCQQETHMGTGERITGLSSCRDTCYRSCVARPLILSFTTTPLFDPRTRQVQVTTGSPVDFSFVGDAPAATALQAVLDFGDSSTPMRLDGDTGKTTHVYTCPSSSCTYVARLLLEDNWQVQSFDSPISTIQIVVSGP